MEAGLHVLCEKMMALGRGVLPAHGATPPARTGRVLEIGHQRYYNPIYQASYDGIVKAGLLGEVYHARLVWHRNGNWRRKADLPSPDYSAAQWGYPTFDHLVNWRLYKQYSRGPHGGARPATWWRSPTGSSARRRRRRSGSGGVFRFKDGREVPDHTYVTLDYPGGRTAVFTSIESNAFDNYYEAYYGTKGTLILKGEVEAYLFEEGAPAGEAKATGIAVAPKAGPGGLRLREPRRRRRRRRQGRGRRRPAAATAWPPTGTRSTASAAPSGPARRSSAGPSAPSPRPGRASPASTRSRRRRGSRSRPRGGPVALGSGPDVRFRTKQEYVYQSLRGAIMRGELAPGQRLVIDEIGRQLQVSAIPIREALQLLQSEGLVLGAPHVGATVAPISEDEVHEVFAIMEGLETVGVREAARRLDDAGLALLSGVVAEMDAAVAAQDYERWAALNSDLHRTINEIARMPLLREMTERVLSRWERLRRHYFQGVVVPRVAQAQGEHHALLDALGAAGPRRRRAGRPGAQPGGPGRLRRLPPAGRPAATAPRPQPVLGPIDLGGPDAPGPSCSVLYPIWSLDVTNSFRLSSPRSIEPAHARERPGRSSPGGAGRQRAPERARRRRGSDENREDS